MKKIKESKLDLGEKLYSSDFNDLIFLRDGRLFKRIKSPSIVRDLEDTYHAMEKKVLMADNFKGIDGLLLPKAAVYDDSDCYVGYIMNYVPGVSLDDYYSTLSDKKKYNIKFHNKIMQELFFKVRELNSNGIIIPDLFTEGNIWINRCRKIVLIGYDGLQIDNVASYFSSTSLGAGEQYTNSKYMKDMQRVLYSNNIDKKSLMLMFFYYFFELHFQHRYEFYTEILGYSKNDSLELIFESVNLSDPQLCKAVIDMYSLNGDNKYIASEINELAKNYTLTYSDNPYLRVLKKK